MIFESLSSPLLLLSALTHFWLQKYSLSTHITPNKRCKIRHLLSQQQSSVHMVFSLDLWFHCLQFAQIWLWERRHRCSMWDDGGFGDHDHRQVLCEAKICRGRQNLPGGQSRQLWVCRPSRRHHFQEPGTWNTVWCVFRNDRLSVYTNT